MTLDPKLSLPTPEDLKKFDGEVNSYGLIPRSFDRTDNEVIEVMRSMGFPLRGTF